MNYEVGQKVTFRGDEGIIDFVDPLCVVIKLNKSAPGRNQPRLVVYNHSFKDIEVFVEENIDPYSDSYKSQQYRPIDP